MTNEDGSLRHKIKLFRSLFTGLNNVYGTYDPKTGRVHQVKNLVSDDVIRRHLMGRQPYGVYLLVKDHIRAIVVDFDTDDLLKPVQYVQRAGEYGITSYIERSKSKGYHVWVFFEGVGVLAAKARLVVQHLLAKIGMPETEVFPKQDILDHRVTYGNFINAPLFGGLVAKGRTVFVDPATPTKPYPNQWDFLKQIQRVRGTTLDAIINNHRLNPKRETLSRTSSPSPTNSGKTYFSLPTCARRMLCEGVSVYQRVACFRLAVSLKRVGLPYDVAVSALKTWAGKNRPNRDKQIITEPEIISQAASAYSKDYRGYGCEDVAIRPFCDPQCPVRKKICSNPPRQNNNEPGGIGSG